jgi:hypothetical protein
MLKFIDRCQQVKTKQAVTIQNGGKLCEFLRKSEPFSIMKRPLPSLIQTSPVLYAAALSLSRLSSNRLISQKAVATQYYEKVSLLLGRIFYSYVGDSPTKGGGRIKRGTRDFFCRKWWHFSPKVLSDCYHSALYSAGESESFGATVCLLNSEDTFCNCVLQHSKKTLAILSGSLFHKTWKVRIRLNT